MIYLCYKEKDAPNFWIFTGRTGISQCPNSVVETSDVIVEVEDHVFPEHLVEGETYVVEGKTMAERTFFRVADANRRVEVVFDVYDAIGGSVMPRLHHIEFLDEKI